jgi:hypothetical protein
MSSWPKPGTDDAQREVYDLIHTHLATVSPDQHASPDLALTTAPDGALLPPLHQAALSVQEDLVLMRKGDSRMAACRGLGLLSLIVEPAREIPPPDA